MFLGLIVAVLTPTKVLGVYIIIGIALSQFLLTGKQNFLTIKEKKIIMFTMLYLIPLVMMMIIIII